MSATGTIGVRGPAPIASAQAPQSRAVAPPTVVAVSTSAVLRRYSPVEHHSHGPGARTARRAQSCAASSASATIAASSCAVAARSTIGGLDFRRRAYRRPAIPVQHSQPGGSFPRNGASGSGLRAGVLDHHS